MNKNNVFVLIHSPLAGPLTWSLVTGQMWKRGIGVIVPNLIDSPDSDKPFWKQHAESVSRELTNIPTDIFLTLVAHSGAGPLLPVIRETISNPVNAYIFVDAGLPQAGASRLTMMHSEDADWAKQFQEYLESGGRFPNWTFEDLQDVIPDDALRRRMTAELHPRGFDFFTEPIPVFDGWPDAPCAYILFSPAYKRAAHQARELGWQAYELEAGHFHMLVDSKVVTDLIVEAANKI